MNSILTCNVLTFHKRMSLLWVTATKSVISPKKCWHQRKASFISVYTIAPGRTDQIKCWRTRFKTQGRSILFATAILGVAQPMMIQAVYWSTVIVLHLVLAFSWFQGVWFCVLIPIRLLAVILGLSLYLGTPADIKIVLKKILLE